MKHKKCNELDTKLFNDSSETDEEKKECAMARKVYYAAFLGRDFN